MEMLYSAFALLVGIGAAALVTYRVMHARHKAALDAIEMRATAEFTHLQERLQERERTVAELTREVATLRPAHTELQVERARLAEKGQQAETLQRQLEQAQGESETLRERLREEATLRAQAEEKNRHIPRLEERLQQREEELKTSADELARAKSVISTLQTRLEEQQAHNAERLKQLEEAKQKMALEFENLANRILEEKSRKFTDQNQTQLGELLKPMREQLDGFRKKVEEIHLTDVKERSSLSQQLHQLRELNQRINEEAANLTRALKGDKKAQGNWGELVLERVLEQSGLRKGVEYETQGAFRDADGRLLKPDVIIHLPEGKDVVVDSKVSLLAYHDYVNAEEEAIREQALKEHVKAVRNHIDGLSGKDYSGLKGLRSLDFVLMFMPMEAAFVAAFQADERLFSDAFERRIVVVTPTTLLATLRTIENIWRYERQNENAREIADRAGAVYDKLRGFVEEMEKLGTQLDTAHRTYEGAMGKLTRGRGNLISQSQKFLELGVKVKKELPKSIVEQADVDLPEPPALPRENAGQAEELPDDILEPAEG